MLRLDFDPHVLANVATSETSGILTNSATLCRTGTRHGTESLCERILDSASIEEKLEPLELPPEDNFPGPPRRVETPARPPGLLFAAPRTAPSMPHPLALADEGKRAVAHHIMANHELQALEVMAWVLLAFPDAPAEFRAVCPCDGG